MAIRFPSGDAFSSTPCNRCSINYALVRTHFFSGTINHISTQFMLFTNHDPFLRLDLGYIARQHLLLLFLASHLR